MTRKRLKKLIMGLLGEDRNGAERLSKFRYLDLKGEVVSNIGKWAILSCAFCVEEDETDTPKFKF